MCENKIQQNLLSLHELFENGEDPKYIVPVFYHSFKTISEEEFINKNYYIDQLKTRFDQFQQEYQPFIYFEQVHFYMLEETQRMVKILTPSLPSLLQKPQSRHQHYDNSAIIVLPQKLYHYDQQMSRQMQSKMSQYQKEFVGTKYKKSSLLRQVSNINIPYQKNTMQDVLDKWIKIEKFYQLHRLDQAYHQIQKFQNACFLIEPDMKLTKKQKLFIEQIHEQYQKEVKFYSYFEESGYTFDKKQNGVSMYYKMYQETKQIAIKIEATVDITVENFLCIINQVDLYQDYIPFAYDTQELKKVARNQKIGLSKVYIPLLSNRRALFFAAAYDRLKQHNSIFFFSETISSDSSAQIKYGFKKPKDPQLVDLNYKFYILEYCPIDEKSGKIRLATNTDLKLQFLPMFVINKTARIFAFDFFKNIVDVNQNFAGSKWEEKMKKNADIYDFFKQRMKQYLVNK